MNVAVAVSAPGVVIVVALNIAAFACVGGAGPDHWKAAAILVWSAFAILIFLGILWAAVLQEATDGDPK